LKIFFNVNFCWLDDLGVDSKLVPEWSLNFVADIAVSQQSLVSVESCNMHVCDQAIITSRSWWVVFMWSVTVRDKGEGWELRLSVRTLQLDCLTIAVNRPPFFSSDTRSV